MNIYNTVLKNSFVKMYFVLIFCRIIAKQYLINNILHHNSNNKIMNIKEFYTISEDYKNKLDLYVLKTDSVNDSYLIAKKLFIDMQEMGMKDGEYRSLVGRWIKSGSTLQLKDILSYTNYSFDRLAHFNAFSLLDAAHCNMITDYKDISLSELVSNGDFPL